MRQQNRQKVRYTEIDVMRGLAVICMVGFHAAYIVQFYYDVALCLASLFWEGIPLLGNIFFILAGLSLYIGASQGKYPTFLSVIQRSSFFLLTGLLITCITCVFDFGARIYFGALHCLGVSTFIGFIVLRLFSKHLILVSGTFIILLGTYYQYIPHSCFSPGLCWLYPCFCPTLYPMLDSYPLIPSLGFLLIGICLGQQYYPHGDRAFEQILLSRLFLRFRVLAWFGEHSLMVYLLHPPIIYGILYLIKQLGLL